MAITRLGAGAEVNVGTISVMPAVTASGTVTIGNGTVAVNGYSTAITGTVALSGTSAVALTAGGTVAVAAGGTVAVNGYTSTIDGTIAVNGYTGTVVNVGDGGYVVAPSVTEYDICQNRHFYLSSVSEIGNGTSTIYAIKTADSAEKAFMLIQSESIATCTFQLFEDVDCRGTNSTAAYNSNRNSSGTADTLIYFDATGTVGGSRIRMSKGGAATTPFRFGFTSRDDQVLALKSDTWYAFQVTSAADNNIISTEFDWAEKTSIC